MPTSGAAAVATVSLHAIHKREQKFGCAKGSNTEQPPRCRHTFARKTVLVCGLAAHWSMSSAAPGGAASAETGAACTVVATSLLASADGGAGAAGSSAAEAPSPAEPAAAPSAPGTPGVDDTPSRGRPANKDKPARGVTRCDVTQPARNIEPRPPFARGAGRGGHTPADIICHMAAALCRV